MRRTVETAAPVTSAAAVANFFIDKYQSESNVPAVDQMKLQKLVYYAHAWHMAEKDAPLFGEDVEAWPWGPVIRDLYIQTKDCGRGAIKAKISKLVPGSEFDEAIFETPSVNDADLAAFLEQVWNVHKNYTGVQLSNSTHARGEPWTVIKSLVGTELKPTIPNDLIASIFKRKSENGNKAASAG